MNVGHDSRIAVCILLTGTLLALTAAHAQEAPAVAEETPDAARQQVLSAGPATPPPGDEVMRPTKHGVELTPRLAEGISRMFVREEMESRCSLRGDQGRRIAEALAGRMMRLSRERGPEGAAAIEYMYETLIRGRGRVNADDAREFAKRMRPGLDIMRDFFDGMASDARSILDDEQYAGLEEFFQGAERMMELFEKKLDRYERGDVVEGGEEPFSGLDDPGVLDEEGRPTPKSQQLQAAERTAQWRTRELGPEGWKRFLDQARTVFQLDEEQYAAGKRLLDEYRGKAEAIMTEEWKQKVRRNRILAYAEYSLHDQPHKPWLFHLEREHKELTAPLKDLGREFHRAALALATAEQWEKVFADLREHGTKHGMTAEEMDLDRLRPQEQAPQETAVR